MLLNVHDKDLKIIGILDNESQDAIGYSEDKWTRDLETGSSVYEFTAYNRKLSYETVYINPFNCLNIGNYVSFTYDGEDHVFKIMSVEKTGKETYCYCENLNLELRNEMVGAYDSGKDELTLEKHISKMHLLDATNMAIGLNELSKVKKAVSFSDEETKLSRLLALFQAFGAEHKFTTKLYANGKVKEFRVDIYKKKDSDGNGGVGRFVKDKILRKGENIKSLKEKQDILEIFNMTVPKGKRKVTRVTQVIPLEKEKKPTVNSNEVIVRSNMINANGTLSIENIQTILKLCYEYRVLPSGVISQLYLESFWGNSNVARVDNNWSGMTWTGNPNRPSGVVVSQGSPRPSSEGGHYMHFANMADFFKDYFYLLAKQGIYNVANKTNISDYTRGLFRVGGAAYDYAAAGYDHYNSLMTGIRNGINAKNENVLDTYDNDWKNPKVVTSTTVEKPGAPNTKKALNELSSLVGKTVGNGQCYAVAAWFSYKLNGAGLGCGLGSFSGLVGSGIRACDIGTDYNWGSFGWGVEGSGFSNKNVVAGTILNIKPNYGAPWYTGYYGHTVVVESVNGDTVTVLQQNYAGKQYVTRDNYSLSAIIPSIQTLVHPSELAKGGRVDGGNAVVKVDSVDKYVNVDLPTEVETKEETEEFYIPDSYNNKWYDENGNVEFYISGSAIRAPQSADNFPVAFASKDNNDRWIRRDFEYEVDTVDELIEKSLEDLKKNCYPTLDYEIDGFFEASIGDTYLIEDDDFEPKLTIKARVISQEISHTQPENNKTELSNYVKLKSAVPDALTSRLQQLIDAAIPYEIRVAASNGTSFKNNEGESELTVELLKSGITQEAEFFFKNGDSLVGKGTKLLVKATDFEHVFNLTIEAYVDNELVATKPITFTDVNDGDDGVGVESIDRYFTSSDQSDGVTIEGAGWSDKPPAPTEDGKYLWAYDEITYTDGTVTTTKPAAVGANFDVDAFRAEIAEDLKDVPNREEFENKIAEELANSKAEITTQIETAKTQAESNAKEYADTINQETAKVAELANAAAGEIKADLVNVKNNLTSTSIVANNAQAAVDAAKQDLAEVASDLNTAKQDLTSHAQQLQTQANAQTELTKLVTTVETTASGTKTTVNELTKTVAQNGKDITSVTNRTKTVEDDLANTKTTLTQVQTTADSTSQKTATLETGLNGVKADLTATTTTANTTKQNLASYQASNDKAVANLQTNLQTANGNISSLKTKVEAVPGQITSAVSSVEGKIPTTVTTRNLILKSNDFANPHKANGDKTTVTSTNDYFVVKSTGYTANGYGGISWNMSISEVKAGEEFSILMPVYIDSSVNLDNGWAFILKNHSLNSAAYDYSIPTNKKNQWFNVAFTFKAYKDVVFDSYPFYVCLVKNGLVRIKPPMLVRGNLIPSDYQPAFEDAQSDITKLDTTLTQTADGLKQLSTQVTSQGNTINTHTTQISALNTGLQAKVSQSDFNTLSGRVTNAENSITAKANELSSKISSVEGKIPTNLDSLNLMTGTRDWSTKANKWHMGANWSTENVEYQGLKVHSTKNGFNGSHQNIFVKNGDVITFSFFAKATNTLSKIKVSSRWPDSSVYQAPLAGVRESDEEITITSEWKRYSKTVHITSDGSLQFRAEYNGATIPNGITFYVAGLKLAKTSQDTGYSENLADVASDISGIAGKIPTSVWVRNYALKTGDSKSTTAGIKLYDLSSAFDGIADDATLIIEFDWRVTAPTSTSKFRINRVIKYSDGTAEQWNDTIVTDGVYTDVSSSGGSGHYSGTFTKVPYNGKAVSSRYLYLNQTTANGTVTISNLSVRVGSLKSDWQPAPEDAISQINSVSSEFKQTTDAIKASVASLDGSTVKNSSLTINADGIVMKAGKSTTDVANAIGSYFSVNQNAINLFSDKINVKGNMIVNGAITSDKIASKQINTAHLNGKIITADVISSNAVTANAIKAGAVTTDKMSANSINGDRIAAGTLDAAKIKAGSITASQIASGTLTSGQIKAGAIKSINIEASAITSDKIAANSISSDKIVANGITANVIKGGTLQSLNGSTNFELDSGKLFYNNNNTGVFRVQNGASTMGLKFSNTSVTVSGTSRILSRTILGGDRRETTLDDGKWDKGGFSGLVIETIKGVEPATNEHADALRAISDTIYFTHTYSADSPTGVSAHGWKMETYAPNSSYSGNIVLKPYGINYRQSDIVVGDIRLDNGDGSGYWMRTTINTLKACFGHILNGGVSSSALNAIRSELDKISGT